MTGGIAGSEALVTSLFFIRLAITCLVMVSLYEMLRCHKRDILLYFRRRDYVVPVCYLVLDVLTIPVAGIILLMLWVYTPAL